MASHSSGGTKAFTLPAAVSTLVARMGVHGCKRLGVQVSNTGANPLTALALVAKAGQSVPDANGITISTNPGTIDTTMLRQAGASMPMAIATTGVFVVDCEGLSELLLYYTSNLGSTITISWAAT